MHEFQVLTEAQGARDKANELLFDAMQRIFRVGAAEVVVDGAGRRMLVEVRHIGERSEAGYLRVMPCNGKRSRRSMRSVHWTQIDREGDDQ